MPPLPRGLSSRDCIKALEKAGFYFVRQKGSHVVMRRDEPFLQVIVPDTNSLPPGTLRNIIKQAIGGAAMSQYGWDWPKHKALYDVPIETLGLSDTTIKPLKRTGVTTVGDCIDFMARIVDGSVLGPLGFNEAAFDELKSQLEAHSYWPPNAPDAD